MVTFDNEQDEVAQAEQKRGSAPGSWDRPLILASLGLAMMLGGYAAMDYLMGARLALFGGLFLFVISGILMYRNSPPPTKDSDERE
ncbi:MAG TPA: hypothetical protein VH592_08740 [Gemmataceae bacterium]|jgi:hypothetical protein